MFYIFLYIIIGVIIGSVLTNIIFYWNKAFGVIVVDHHTQQCIAKMNYEELTEKKKKYALFKIDHNGDLSRI